MAAHHFNHVLFVQSTLPFLPNLESAETRGLEEQEPGEHLGPFDSQIFPCSALKRHQMHLASGWPCCGGGK